MAGLLVLVWLGLGLCGHLTVGHGALTTSTTTERSSGEEGDSGVTPCVGQQALAAIEEDLKALKQAVMAPQPQYSVTGLGSSRDLLELKNKLIVMGTKLEAAEIKMQAANTKLEAKLEAAETKLEAAETKLEAAETKLEAKLEAAETKLETAETKLEAAETTLEAMEATLKTSGTEVKELRSALEKTDSVLQNTQTQVQKRGATASTFVRWGRKTCSNSSKLLYSGVVGGSQHSHPGAAANALCLTRDPEFDSTPLPSAHTYIYGAEYEHIPGHHDHDVPCSVCHTPHPTTLMIPSTHSCPSGWTTQYTGHLASGHHTHPAATEFVCLDEEPEDVSSGHTNENGYLFYYVAYICGSLPCPPYINKKIALCVVCSK